MSGPGRGRADRNRCGNPVDDAEGRCAGGSLDDNGLAMKKLLEVFARTARSSRTTTPARAEEAVVPIDRGRMERRRRELALDVAAGRMSERAFLAAMRRLNEEDAALVDPRPRRAAYGAKAVEYIRNFAASWVKAKLPTRAAMIPSLYQEVAGERSS